MPLPMVQRLAIYFERGVTSVRAAHETGLPLREVRDQYRRFRRIGLSRRITRRIWNYFERATPLPYKGPEWIGKANSVTPLPVGPGWIGKKHVDSTADSDAVH